MVDLCHFLLEDTVQLVWSTEVWHRILMADESSQGPGFPNTDILALLYVTLKDNFNKDLLIIDKLLQYRDAGADDYSLRKT
jgi:hypothetical protein